MKNIKLMFAIFLALIIYSPVFASPPAGYTTVANTVPECAKLGFCGETSCIVEGNRCPVSGWFLTLNSKPELNVDFAGYAKDGFDISKCRYQTTEYLPGTGQKIVNTSVSALAATGQTNPNFVGSIPLASGYSNSVNNAVLSFKNSFGTISDSAYNVWQASGCPMSISAETAAKIKQSNAATCRIASAYVVCPNPASTSSTNPNAIPSVVTPPTAPTPSVQIPPSLPQVQNTYENQQVPNYCRSPKC